VPEAALKKYTNFRLFMTFSKLQFGYYFSGLTNFGYDMVH